MRIAIIGATGYSGIELIRLIQQHPFVQLKMVVSTSQVGKEIQEIYPHLSGIIDHHLEQLDIERLAEEVDLVFFATPSGISKDIIPTLIKHDVTCIDLSGDFRLKSGEVYEAWYKHTPAPQEYLEQAVYGLSEMNAERIKKAALIANPGCYPTASLLALIPVLQNGWVDKSSIIIDGKSGVSGAGRSVSLATHYAEVNESIKAYKLGEHQHIPEIEQVLSEVCKESINVTFSTHLIPMTRGIMCTIYTNLTEHKTTNDIIQLYQNYYKNHPFVRIRPEGTWPSTKEVYGSNYCDLGFVADPRTGRLTIVSVIDNVVKGAAGQAIQNMNVIADWDMTTGLSFIPIYP
ncbi:MAG: N-acetyl-gamma-glutamyl-phosphate reductase [Bacilli bacterium]